MDDVTRLPRPAFASGGLDAWRARVERELGGADFDRALRTRLAGGLTLEPLYTATARRHGGAGRAPYARGARATPGDWSHGAPWTIAARYADPDLGAQNAALLADLRGGVGGLVLEFDPEPAQGLEGLDEGLPVATLADLGRLLDGVLLDAVELDLDAGGAFLSAAAACVAHADRAGVERGALRVRFGADPLGALARDGALPGTLERAFDQLALLVRACERYLPRSRAATVDAGAFHRAGASPAEELGLATASLAATLRALIERGIEPAVAARQLGLAVELGREPLLEIAKLRALRVLWSAVCRAAGLDQVPEPHVRASSSARMLTERDPWTNILRVAGATFAAAVGGADVVVAGCFDECLGAPSALARRVARNTQSVLAEESGLGRVLDPAGGSHFIETLTADLVAAGWAVAQEIERDGGLAAALLDGRLAARLEAGAEALRRDVARRKHPILGTSEYPDLDERLPEPPALADPGEPPAAATGTDTGVGLSPEAGLPEIMAALSAGAGLAAVTRALAGDDEPAVCRPLAAFREAEGFEALRDAAEAAGEAAPRVVVLTLGPRAEHGARTGWVRNLYAAGGLRTVERALTADEAGLAEALGDDPALVCLSGADARYADELEGALQRVAARTAARVVVAGRPGEHERAWRAAGAHDFVHVGIDVLAHLREVLGPLAAESPAEQEVGA